MLRCIAATILSLTCFVGTASAGHHYYYSYPAYPVYAAPVYVAPVYVPPVVVHTPAYVVPAPVYYPPVSRRAYWHGYRPWYGKVEIDVDWKRHGYEIEIDYDD